MGWSFGWETKKGLIEELTSRGGPDKCVAKSTVGNHLWTVWETRNTSYICLYLLSKDKRYGWGYKGMVEAMGPYYYDCPLRFLEMAPALCGEWRESVKIYHNNKKRMREHRAKLKPGVRVKVKDRGPYADEEFVVEKIYFRKKACVLSPFNVRFYPESLEVL